MESTATAVPGQTIGDRYRIVRKLAEGGMAEVFLASAGGAAGFERLVVVKRLLPRLAAEPEFIDMFLDEARLGARLHHQNIAQVFEFGEHDGAYFMAMEYLDGRDAAAIRRAAADRGGVPLPHALAIAIGAAAGLHHAHELRDDGGAPLGVVHRDVSGANVFVTVDGGVKVVDFGIARAAGRQAVTRTGLIKGKVEYMSPEQVRGEPLDRRSDVFSLGIVLYELVCGRRPFDRAGDGDFAIMQRIVRGELPAAAAARPDCPAALDAALRRALAGDPARRQQTAEELLAELESVGHAAALQVSTRELGAWMRGLDGAVAAGPEPARADPEAPSTVPMRGQRAPGAPAAAPGPAAPAPARPRTGPMVAAVAAAAAGLGAVGFLIAGRGGGDAGGEAPAAAAITAGAGDCRGEAGDRLAELQRSLADGIAPRNARMVLEYARGRIYAPSSPIYAAFAAGTPCTPAARAEPWFAGVDQRFTAIEAEIAGRERRQGIAFVSLEEGVLAYRDAVTGEPVAPGIDPQ